MKNLFLLRLVCAGLLFEGGREQVWADGSGKGGKGDSQVLFTFPDADSTPSTPDGLYISNADGAQVVLDWSASTPIPGHPVVRYEVFLNGVKVGETAHGDDLELSADYHPKGDYWEFFTVRAFDDAGRASPQSREVRAPHDDAGTSLEFYTDFKQTLGFGEKIGFQGLLTNKFYRTLDYEQHTIYTGYSNGVEVASYDNQVTISETIGQTPTVAGQMVSNNRPDLFYPSGTWSYSDFAYPPRAVLKSGTTVLSDLVVPTDGYMPAINDPAKTDIFEKVQTDTTGPDSLYPFDASRTSRFQRLDQLTLGQEFTDAELRGQVQAAYADAQGIAADWGQYAFSDGAMNSGIGYYEGSPEFLAQRSEPKRIDVLSGVSLMSAVYRLKAFGSSERQSTGRRYFIRTTVRLRRCWRSARRSLRPLPKGT